VMVIGLFVERRIYVSSSSLMELMLTICSGILLYFVAILPEEEFVRQVWQNFSITPIDKRRGNQEVLSYS
jgi:hypothetical protein